MIKAVHIEDEPRNIDLLQSLIKTHCAGMVTLAGNARSISDAVRLIKNVNPQLVYLDIELNQGNAFDLLDQLKDFDFEIIFITAFNEYAVKAFRLNAVDYLLKPISIIELKEATMRAVERIHHSMSNKENLAKVIQQMKPEQGASKIGLPVSDGLLFINTDDIVRINAKGSYSVLFMSGKKNITCPRNLKALEQLLPASGFLRVHHSWIINLKYLKKYFRGKQGFIEMEDGSTVPVSVRKKGKFLDQLPE